MRGVSLDAEQGRLAYILPNTFLMGSSYLILRQRLCAQTSILQIVDLPQNVFESATVDNVLLFLQRGQRENHRIAVAKLNTDSSLSKIATRDWDDSFAILQAGLTEQTQYKLNVHITTVRLSFGRLLFQSDKIGISWLS